jgi:acyl dehydratase
MSLLTDDIRAMVGRQVSYTAPEPVGRAAIRYYALATRDEAPEHRSGEVPPPTLVFDTNQYADRQPDDDGYAGHRWDIALAGGQTVRGGHEYRWHRPLRPDDVVTASWTLVDIAERRTSRGMPMLVVTSRCCYAGGDGDPIAEQTETMLHIGPKFASARAGGDPVRRPVHPTDAPVPSPGTPEQTADRPGAPGNPTGTLWPGPGTRGVGSEVPPLVRAFDLAAMVAYAGATWDWHRLHYDAGYAAERGLPAPVVDGQVFGALLAQMLRRWLGPDAALRRMSFRFAAPVFAGETVRCSGTVTGTDGPVLLVSLRVDVVDSNGEAVRAAVSPASAEVEVPAQPWGEGYLGGVETDREGGAGRGGGGRSR